MSHSSQSPCEVACTVSCDEHHDHCCDDSATVHVHVHVHHHHHCCRPATVKPVALPVVKFGFSGPGIGHPSYPNLLTQINQPSNYGADGIYNKVQSVSFLNASVDIVSSPLTAAELLAKYDVLSVGLHNSTFTMADAIRLKDYAALGGVVLLICDGIPSVGLSNVLQQFGHTGNLAGNIAGDYSGVSSATENLSSYFGSSSGVTLKGRASLAITPGQLPPGSRVLATAGAHVLFWVVGATKDRVVAMSDVELTTYDVAGTDVDTGKEKFLNNMISYLIDKALERT